MNDAAYCVCNNAMQAHHIVDELRAMGFPGDEVSTLFPDGSRIAALAGLGGRNAPVGGVLGDGLPGRGLGWLAGVGALDIPGVGAFLAAGPFVGVLSAAAAGANGSGLAGALVGLGIAAEVSHAYEAQLRSGGILLSVHVDDQQEGDHAREIFERRGATHVSVGSRGPAAARSPAKLGTKLATLGA